MMNDKDTLVEPGLNQMREGILLGNLVVHKADATGQGAGDVGVDFDSADAYPSERLMDVVKLVRTIMSTDLPAYERVVTARRVKYDRLPWFARGTNRHLGGLILAPHQDYECHSEIMAFFHAVDSVGLDSMQLCLPTNAFVVGRDGALAPLAEKINQLVVAVRRYMLHPDTLATIKSRKKNAKDNLKSMQGYVMALVRYFARLLVLRVDFAYTKECGLVSIERVKADIERFLGNRRTNKMLSTIEGYICKFEYGLQKGLHVHCLFFLDGSKHQKHEYLAQQFGEYWRDRITHGQGCFYSCHGDKNKYKQSCIGQLGHRDTEKIQALFVCLAYFNKIDQYIPPKMLKGHKAFTKGKHPPEPSGRGRPRDQA